MYPKHLNLTSGIAQVGGHPLNVLGQSPYDMAQYVDQWQDQLKQNTSTIVGLSMSWRNWYDINEVQVKVDNHSDASLTELFTAVPPSTSVFSDLTLAYKDFHTVRNTAR